MEVCCRCDEPAQTSVDLDGEVYHLCPECWGEYFAKTKSFCTRKKMKKPTVVDPPNRKKNIDVDKVVALHKAGWQVEKIAAEMGVRQSTVYYHLKKERKKWISNV